MKFSRTNPLSRIPFSRTFHRVDPALPLMLFDADPGGGPGGNPPVVKQSDIDEAVQKRIAELLGTKKVDNDPMAALSVVIKQNHALEKRAETAETALADAKKTGISDTDKADLATLRELGIKPGEAKAEIEAGRTAKGEAAESKRLTMLEKAAKDLGYRPSALKRLSPRSEVIEEQIDVKGQDGKVTKESRYFFKDGETKTEISQHFADDTEALEMLADTGAATGGVGIKPYPKGPPIGGGKTTDVWDKIRESKKPKEAEKPVPSWQEQAGVRP